MGKDIGGLRELGEAAVVVDLFVERGGIGSLRTDERSQSGT